MEVGNNLFMSNMDNFDYQGKTVLMRLDINSPIDPKTKKITSDNRIKKSLPTIKKALEKGARLVLIAHQGDTLDYQNLISLEEHAEKLSRGLNIEVKYIDDVCGPAAQQVIKDLNAGEVVLLGNLRYLTEEVSTFENAVKLEASEMLDTYLVRSLAPLVDFYVNDAFSAAHRNCPSMVAFQEIKPTAAGELMYEEIAALTKIMSMPEKPCVFVLGGAKISDAFGMMRQVLENGTADLILTSGITGEIMLMAQGINLGKVKEKIIKDRGLDVFVKDAKEYLEKYPEKMKLPIDLAFSKDGARKEIDVVSLPVEEIFLDIGSKTIEMYKGIIGEASTIFVNGPAGAYEKPEFEAGTRTIWEAIAKSSGYSVIGGGDTVAAAQRYTELSDFGYVCTAGGAMVQFLSGDKLPLISAMEKAYLRERR